MSLPFELRGMIYSEALALGVIALLCVSKQVKEEATPYLWKSGFLVLGKDGMVIEYPSNPFREALLLPHILDDRRTFNLVLYDRVASKLALIQNLATEIDFLKLRSTRELYPGLRHRRAQHMRRARISGDRLPTFDPFVGFLGPFLTPQSGSSKRNTCEITLKNFLRYDHASVDLDLVLEVLVRLNNFKNIFVTFESPKVRKPGKNRGSIGRRFNACKEMLQAALGTAIWHAGEGGYLAFHPSG